ncbi:MAG: MFS transporter [Coriobacteriia bacterium]|nr:MFS transporter [Coriobacteriia bacterium]
MTAHPNSLSIWHIMAVVTPICACFFTSSMVFNTWSVYVVPVCDSLGASTGSFASYVSIVYLFSAIAAPFAGSLVQKHDVRIVYTIAVGMCAAGMGACSFYTEVWQFYVSGAIEGAGVVVIVSLMAPVLVTRWFNKHTGLLMGLCAAMMGIGGAVWSMVAGVLLRDFGWQTGYLVFGIIAATPMLLTLFCVRSNPSDVGLLPYGADDAATESDALPQHGISSKDAFRMPAFYLLAITIGLTNGAAQIGNYPAKYVYHLADIGALLVPASEVIIMASIIAMCVQVSQACAKVGLGFIADRSSMMAFILAYGCSLTGILLCWQGAGISTGFVYGSAVLIGVLYGTTNSLGPSVTRNLFGSRDYSIIYSRIAVVVNLIPVAFIPFFAFLADLSWDLLFGASAVIVALIFACSMATIYFGKRITRTVE